MDKSKEKFSEPGNKLIEFVSVVGKQNIGILEFGKSPFSAEKVHGRVDFLPDLLIVGLQIPYNLQSIKKESGTLSLSLHPFRVFFESPETELERVRIHVHYLVVAPVENSGEGGKAVFQA